MSTNTNPRTARPMSRLKAPKLVTGNGCFVDDVDFQQEQQV